MSNLLDVLEVILTLMLYIFCAVSDVQIRFILTYCTLCTIYEAFWYVLANICSYLQGVHTKVRFS